jgi:acetolactate synthase I/II/III large subunit
MRGCRHVGPDFRLAAVPAVADLLVEGLRRAGVPRLFAARGDAAASAVLGAARARGVPVVVAHTESSASLMAAVTGELTGTPGVVVVGPVGHPRGAATGVAYAFADRAPLILITERDATSAARRLPATPGPASAMPRPMPAPPGPVVATTRPAVPDPVDHVAFLGAVTKQSLAVEPASASHWIAHAAQLALNEPRGPVHLDLTAQAAAAIALPVAASTVRQPLAAPDPAELERAAELIRRADRPLIIAGLACRTMEDSKWLRAFAEAMPAPVLTTPKAKGVMPEPHPLSLGIFTNGALEEPFVRRADLIVAVGLDTVELEPRPWTSPAVVVHLARMPHGAEHVTRMPDPAEFFRPAVGVVGEPAAIFEELAPRLSGMARADWDVVELDRVKREQLARLAVTPVGPTARRGSAAGKPLRSPAGAAAVPALGPTGASPGLPAHRVIEIARELSPVGTVAVTDPGPHAMDVTWFWPAVAPAEFLIPSPSSPPRPGFALPAAIAAQLVYPDRRLVCFTGPTGLLNTAAELETAVRLHSPVVVLFLADAGSAVDIEALARSVGLDTEEAADEASMRRALSAALGDDRPAVIHARIA